MGVNDRSLMTWQSDKSRWRKMYKGQWYFVTCKDLRVVPTKEASYRLANAWWREKQIQLDSLRPQHPHAETLDLLRRKQDWLSSRGLHDERKQLEERIARVDALGDQDDEEGTENTDLLNENIRIAEFFGIVVPPDLDPIVARQFFGDGRIWGDRLLTVKDLDIPSDRTIGGFLSRYLELELARYSSKQLSASEYDTTRRCLEHFRDWVGSKLEPKAIGSSTWERYWLYLIGELNAGRQSQEYAKKRFRHAKSFISWMASQEAMPIPINLHNRKFRFGNDARKLSSLTIDEARLLVLHATGQLKLHLLLFLNCGMTQADVSKLKPSEVDWTDGRVTRKRGKTSRFESVPIVSYQLWPETWRLLKEFGKREGDHALLTRSGKTWIEESIVNGKLKSRDGIYSLYRHLQTRLGLKHPLKAFRKTSPTLLDTNPDFARYGVHFLGQSPRGVAARNYITPSITQFDRAVSWLGDQYGFGNSDLA